MARWNLSPTCGNSPSSVDSSEPLEGASHTPSTSAADSELASLVDIVEEGSHSGEARSNSYLALETPPTSEAWADGSTDYAPEDDKFDSQADKEPASSSNQRKGINSQADDQHNDPHSETIRTSYAIQRWLAETDNEGPNIIADSTRIAGLELQ